MDKSAGHDTAVSGLYPISDPFDQRMLDVGHGHQVYVEQCGHPDGIPVVVLHGGPGGGCSPAMRRFFDPRTYRVVLFDQRGCGRSKPAATIEHNTTQHLIADIELIRQTLGIQRWVVFGGSWGATLALAYAQAHPEMVAYLVLRGVFTGTQAELDWFYGGGAGRFFPELWAQFLRPVPADEQHDLIAAYGKRLFSGDRHLEDHFARSWTRWENALAAIETRGPGSAEAPATYARAFARLENHYFRNGCFLGEDRALMRNLGRMQHIPGTIVQGRYDMICPPTTAWELHAAWGMSRLEMVPVAGHALSEPGISAELLRVMNHMRYETHRLNL
ncbi:prolyl aminopeptidase [Roseinatronobacter alkalisoli]|uniref:Proline iminopeptidase n=1 Tax=Roseinatronobacter alkalisoli TaxID=3028235 RepID=A0ABT5T8Z4_9RHOB|nr:prolyl aminopeptidase [Roseinatronobacter sp. HJB301]MDD7971594.1 prolyl aminopeptidase [Roseinatronobacter sp. HJB301]